MRFFFVVLITVAFIITTALSSPAPIVPQSQTTATIPAPPHKLDHRAVRQGTLCANVPIKARLTILTYVSDKDICLCTQNGQLTQRSQQDLRTALDRMGTGGLIGSLLRLLGQTLDGLSTLLFGNANTEVNSGSLQSRLARADILASRTAFAKESHL
ncbi:hypothetical protein FFLO_01999 [Filobasidium floriforme]|uniref:Uncharacterized protein n=1 Tax=Filobasidium floriforme TaxID=5210 RepID=A0A8K0JQB9_9TREE|nr:hypothetical protein FFLO_01999 [Filobasidium floriforme]